MSEPEVAIIFCTDSTGNQEAFANVQFTIYINPYITAALFCYIRGLKSRKSLRSSGTVRRISIRIYKKYRPVCFITCFLAGENPILLLAKFRAKCKVKSTGNGIKRP